MKIFCENKLTIEECRKMLETEYQKNKQIKFFKEIDWYNAFGSFILSMLFSGIICSCGALFLKNITLFTILFFLILFILVGLFIYIDTDMNIDNKKEYLSKIKDAYENYNNEDFLKFLSSYYYKEFERIIFTLLEKNEIKILKLQYSQDTDILNLTYDRNGLVENENFYVRDYQLRTNIIEDELVLNNHNQIIYKQAYKKESE